MKIRNVSVWLYIVMAACLVLSATSSRADEDLPFGPGEKLTYEIRWTVFRAGTAVLEVMPDTEMDGTPVRHFRAEARTTPWIDRLYRVRDTMEAWTDLGVNYALRYKKDQNEGSYHKKVDLVFDKQENKTFRYIKGELKHTLDQPELVYDPMSILYGFRKQTLFKGMQFGSNVTDGKKSVVGEAKVVGMTDIETPMGEIPCYKVELDVKHISGVFKKSKNAKLVVWFSADKRCIPVRVRSKVAVGHFSLELMGYEPPTPLAQTVVDLESDSS